MPAKLQYQSLFNHRNNAVRAERCNRYANAAWPTPLHYARDTDPRIRKPLFGMGACETNNFSYQSKNMGAQTNLATVFAPGPTVHLINSFISPTISGIRRDIYTYIFLFFLFFVFRAFIRWPRANPNVQTVREIPFVIRVFANNTFTWIPFASFLAHFLFVLFFSSSFSLYIFLLLLFIANFSRNRNRGHKFKSGECATSNKQKANSWGPSFARARALCSGPAEEVRGPCAVRQRPQW